ncbi:hypothetical protein Ancab_035995 [Ancistrocladus abbreviatus]
MLLEGTSCVHFEHSITDNGPSQCTEVCLATGFKFLFYKVCTINLLGETVVECNNITVVMQITSDNLWKHLKLKSLPCLLCWHPNAEAWHFNILLFWHGFDGKEKIELPSK